MTDLNDVHRLAQNAHDVATEAKHDAEKATMSIEAHEKICAERYAGINEKLADVKRAQSLSASDQKTVNTSISVSLNELQSKFNKMAGVDMTLRYIISFLGACGTVFGLIKALH